MKLTDVHTGRVLTHSVHKNARVHAVGALHAAVEHIPFPVAGLDFANGLEFINNDVINLAAHCRVSSLGPAPTARTTRPRSSPVPTTCWPLPILRIRHPEALTQPNHLHRTLDRPPSTINRPSSAKGMTSSDNPDAPTSQIQCSCAARTRDLADSAAESKTQRR